MNDPSKAEESVKACYSTWSDTYYDEYYGEGAPYPPVHSSLIAGLIDKAGAHRVLDAGCGPASFVRDLPDGLDIFGFDLTPEMVVEARKVMGARGIPEDHFWEGSVLDPEAFAQPGTADGGAFDAAVCIGVLPHIPADTDETVLANLRSSLRPGGLVVLEARNQLFSLFTLNRYSHEMFLETLIPVDDLRARAGDESADLDGALDEMRSLFRTDQPPIRKGKADEPGYDEVLSRTHNPFVLRQQAEKAGFDNARVLFYHFHALPPLVGSRVPRSFREASVAMEDPEDWRGYVMASAFLVVGTRP